MRVAVLGASNKTDRPSHQAVLRLLRSGHIALPVHPALAEVAGIPCLPNLSELMDCEVITIYISPKHQGNWVEELAHMRPGTLIFNPGTENPDAYPALEAEGWQVVEACTLVLLGTGQWNSVIQGHQR